MCGDVEMSEGEFRKRVLAKADLEETHGGDDYNFMLSIGDFFEILDEVAKSLRKALNEGQIEEELRRWFGNDI